MIPIEQIVTVHPGRQERTNLMEEKQEPRAANPEELVELFSADVWRFVSSQLSRREDAEDVVMEVFSAAIGEFSKLRTVESQRLWLLSIARRKVADSLRKHYRRAEKPLTDAHETAALPMANDLQVATEGALAKLADHERQALVLKYINGLSTEEISMVIQKSIAATNSLLQRARHSFREAMGPRLLDVIGEI